METKKLTPAKETSAQLCFKMKAALILILCTLTGNIVVAHFQDPDTYPIVPLNSLLLNRTATYLSEASLSNLNYQPAFKGFRWDPVDMGHEGWYPQGITGTEVDSSKFLAVSWIDDDTQVRGSWIAFVNITNMEDSIKYRHVLLVDTNYLTFQGLQAGGITIHGDTLYVTDSRGPNYILKFNLNNIREVPDIDTGSFYSFKYILQLSGKQPSPIKPSSVSYDYDQGKIAICSFNSNASPDDNQAGWYNLEDYNLNSPFYDHFIKNMKGIASRRDPADTVSSIIYIATKSANEDKSELFVLKHQFVQDTVQGQNADLGRLSRYSLPDFIQSLYLEENGLNLWSLSDSNLSNPLHGSAGKVFCMHTNDIKPLIPLPFDSLPLSRTGKKKNQSELVNLNLKQASIGFTWDDADNIEFFWCPLGIAGFQMDSSKFIVTCWNQGSRISFVNITNMDSIKYQHVALADSNGAPLSADDLVGLIVVGDTLFVGSDSSPYYLMKFNINNILEVPDWEIGDYSDHHYILQLSGRKKLPIQPGYLSYDYDHGKMVAGTSNSCTGNYPPYCSDNSLNQAGWFDVNTVSSNSPYFKNFIGNMSGIASKSDPLDSARTQVWIMNNSNLDNLSHLYVFNEKFDQDTVQGQVAHLGNSFTHYSMMPDVRSLYIEENGQNLWALSPNREYIIPNPAFLEAIIFCMPTQNVPPPVYCYTQDKLTDKTYCLSTVVEQTATTNYVHYGNFVKANKDWINCNTIANSLMNYDRSVFAWIKKGPILSGESQSIVGINSPNSDICNLYVNTDNELAMWDGSSDHTTGVIVADSVWHFVGYTYNNTSNITHVYVDGVLHKTYVNSQHVTSPADRISIGQEFDNDTKGNYYNGMITEVSFWNTVLDSAEINLIKHRSINSAHPKYNKLKAYYSMRIGSDDNHTIVTDYSPDGNDGYTTNIYLQELSLLQIPGYNSIDHFAKSWRKGQTLLSTAETLSFPAAATSAGPYQLNLTSGKYVINDEFNLTILGNFVAGSISANQVIVHQAIPAMLTATLPSGGNAPYHYQWEFSTDSVNFTNIPGATSASYQPGALTATTWYRQEQSSEGGGCIAQTNVVKINVVPVPPPTLTLTNHTIANGVTKCYNATQTITVGGIGTTFLVQTGGSIDLIAGQNIYLEQGTRVVAGGYLHGYITTTGDYCYGLHYVLPANPGQNMKETVEVPIIAPDNIFDCYPNPNAGRFNLRLSTEPGETPAVVKIYNLMGMEIEKKTLYSGKLHEISLEGQVEGIYLVSVMQNGKSGIRKVIVNR